MPTKQLNIYQVDAFTSKVFSGNPAAVCFLDQWLAEETMQAIAAENNLAETAFLVADASAPESTFTIRWFTPTVEIPLCGHATLASAHVLYEHLNCDAAKLSFHSKGGTLSVVRVDDGYALNLPAFEVAKTEINAALAASIKAPVLAQYQGNYPMLVLENAEVVRKLTPDFNAIVEHTDNGTLVVTSTGDEVDFVSRFFGPGLGINEDPVTGSAHCMLTPFWSATLDKEVLSAKQLSARGGELQCSLDAGEVQLVGQCATYLIGTVFL